MSKNQGNDKLYNTFAKNLTSINLKFQSVLCPCFKVRSAVMIFVCMKNCEFDDPTHPKTIYFLFLSNQTNVESIKYKHPNRPIKKSYKLNTYCNICSCLIKLIRSLSRTYIIWVDPI